MILPLLMYFIYGYTISIAIYDKKRIDSLSLSLIPFFSAIIPAMITIVSGYFEFQFVEELFITGAILCTVWKRGAIRKDVKSLLSFFQESSLKHKLLIITLATITLGLIVRISINEVWSGDGLNFWAMRAQEWHYNRGFFFREPIALSYKTWSSYPRLHSVFILSNYLFFPSFPHIITANIYDGLFFVGIIFCFYAFAKDQQLPYAYLVAMLCAFSLREFVGGLSSSYAEVDVAYFYLLSLLFLLKNIQGDFKYILIWTLCSGALIAVKSEGMYRLVLMIGSASLFYFKELKKNGRSLTICLFLIALIYFLDKNFRGPVNKGQYLDALAFSLDKLSRLKGLIESYIISFSYHNAGVHKSSWPVILSGLILFFPSYLKLGGSQKKIYGFILSLFVLNLIFNGLPFVIVKHVVDPRLNDPREYALLVLGRLNSQVYFLPILFLLGVVPYSFSFKRRQEDNP